jgi:hypothetical protein
MVLRYEVSARVRIWIAPYVQVQFTLAQFDEKCTFLPYVVTKYHKWHRICVILWFHCFFWCTLLLRKAPKYVSFGVYMSFWFTLKGMNSSSAVIQFSSSLDKTQTCFHKNSFSKPNLKTISKKSHLFTMTTDQSILFTIKV